VDAVVAFVCEEQSLGIDEQRNETKRNEICVASTIVGNSFWIRHYCVQRKSMYPSSRLYFRLLSCFHHGERRTKGPDELPAGYGSTVLIISSVRAMQKMSNDVTDRSYRPWPSSGGMVCIPKYYCKRYATVLLFVVEAEI
jgi:hypothetical protein